jgi:hypothetical protein
VSNFLHADTSVTAVSVEPKPWGCSSEDSSPPPRSAAARQAIKATMQHSDTEPNGSGTKGKLAAAGLSDSAQRKSGVKAGGKGKQQKREGEQQRAAKRLIAYRRFLEHCMDPCGVTGQAVPGASEQAYRWA